MVMGSKLFSKKVSISVFKLLTKAPLPPPLFAFPCTIYNSLNPSSMFTEACQDLKIFHFENEKRMHKSLPGCHKQNTTLYWSKANILIGFCRTHNKVYHFLNQNASMLEACNKLFIMAHKTMKNLIGAVFDLLGPIL